MKASQGFLLGSAIVVVALAGTVGPGSATASDTPPGASPRKPPVAAKPEQTEEQKTLYAVGVIISHNLEDLQLTPAEFDLVKSGLVDGFNHRASQVDLAAAGPKVQALERERFALLVKKQQAEGQTYLDKAAALSGAHKTASGLVVIPIQAGTGAIPGHDDQVRVNYQGKLIDGTVFDSSIQRGQPASFALSGVIPCWTEALQLMKVGDKSRIVCPPNLAYGARGAPPKIRPQATLDFEVELLGITAPAMATTPAAAPATEPAAATAPAVAK
jgi:FKBP-type peptidyl-prolyl cis-trans isomerase FkpA